MKKELKRRWIKVEIKGINLTLMIECWKLDLHLFAVSFLSVYGLFLLLILLLNHIWMFSRILEEITWIKEEFLAKGCTWPKIEGRYLCRICSRILLSFCVDKREVFMGIVVARWHEDECMRVRFSPCDD